MHSLIIGMTESGKTTLAKSICKGLIAKEQKVAVLDPLHDEGWGEVTFQTSGPAAFLEWAKMKENRQAFLFVDEGSIAIGRYNAPMEWLATMSRHWGHSSFFISQSLTQLSTTLRGQCGRLYLFTAAETVNKIAAEEFNEKELRKADRLEKGQFYIVNRFTALKKMRIEFDTGEVSAS